MLSSLIQDLFNHIVVPLSRRDTCALACVCSTLNKRCSEVWLVKCKWRGFPAVETTLSWLYYYKYNERYGVAKFFSFKAKRHVSLPKLSSMSNIAKVSSWESNGCIYAAVVDLNGLCYIGNRDKFVLLPVPVKDALIHCDEKVFVSALVGCKLMQVLLSLDLDIELVYIHKILYPIESLLTSSSNGTYYTLVRFMHYRGIGYAELGGVTVELRVETCVLQVFHQAVVNAGNDLGPFVQSYPLKFSLEDGVLRIISRTCTTIVSKDVLFLRKCHGPVLCYVKKYE